MATPGRLPEIQRSRCTGCGRCVAVCAPHLLSLEVLQWQKFAVLHDPQRCTACSDCAVVCPFHAITMRPSVQVAQVAPPAQGSVDGQAAQDPGATRP